MRVACELVVHSLSSALLNGSLRNGGTLFEACPRRLFNEGLAVPPTVRGVTYALSPTRNQGASNNRLQMRHNTAVNFINAWETELYMVNRVDFASCTKPPLVTV